MAVASLEGVMVDREEHINSMSFKESKPELSPYQALMGGSRKLHTTAVIKAGQPFYGDLHPDKIVTADLEALITKDGLNLIFMAAWFNGLNFRVFDITNHGNNSNSMLQAFPRPLVK